MASDVSMDPHSLPGTSTEHSGLVARLYWNGQLVETVSVPQPYKENYEVSGAVVEENGRATATERSFGSSDLSQTESFFPRTRQDSWSTASEYARLFCIDTRGARRGEKPRVHLCHRYFDRWGMLAAARGSDCPPEELVRRG